MLTEHYGPRSYLLGALAAAPDVFEFSLRDLTTDESDFRPDAERFTIREVVAHLADWDAIFLERLRRTRAENEPLLLEIDEGELAIQHDYARAETAEKLRIFRATRAQMCEFAGDVAADEWQRVCQHPRAGRLTLEALAMLVVMHDVYHLRQIVQWREAFAAMRADTALADHD